MKNAVAFQAHTAMGKFFLFGKNGLLAGRHETYVLK